MNNEILFWKVYKNLVIRTNIFNQIKIMKLQFKKNDDYFNLKYYIGNRIKFEYIKKLSWLIKRKQFNLIKDKIKDLNSGLIINSKSMYYLIERHTNYNNSEIEMNHFKEILELLYKFRTIELLSIPPPFNLIELSSIVNNLISLSVFKNIYNNNSLLSESKISKIIINSINYSIYYCNLESLQFLILNFSNNEWSPKLYLNLILPYYNLNKFNKLLKFLLFNNNNDDDLYNLIFKGEKNIFDFQTFLYSDNYEIQFKMLELNQVEIITNINQIITQFSLYDIINLTPPIKKYLQLHFNSISIISIIDNYFIKNLKNYLNKNNGVNEKIKKIKKEENENDNKCIIYNKYNSNYNDILVKRRQNRNNSNIQISNHNNNNNNNNNNNDDSNEVTINLNYFFKYKKLQDLFNLGEIDQVIWYCDRNGININSIIKIHFRQFKKLIKYYDLDKTKLFLNQFLNSSIDDSSFFTFTNSPLSKLKLKLKKLISCSIKNSRIDQFEYLILIYKQHSNNEGEEGELTEIIIDQILYSCNKSNLKMIDYLLNSNNNNNNNNNNNEIIPILYKNVIESNNLIIFNYLINKFKNNMFF